MKIKRFFAKEMRDGIRMVRKELGADAVILSNNRVNGGIEIIAAVDYDEALLRVEPAAASESINDKHNASVTTQSVSQQAAPQTVNSQSKHNSAPASIFQNVADASDKAQYVRYPQADAQAAYEQSRLKNRSERGSDLLADTLYLDNDDLPALDFGFDDDLEDGADKQGYAANGKQSVFRSEDVEWSQEPTLIQMQHEMRDIRDLLEQQLSSLAWGELRHRDPTRAKLTRGLLELSLSPRLCKHIIDTIPQSNSFETLWRNTLALLAQSLPTDGSDVLEQGGIVALIGATGVGKTTTIAKLAARYALRHGCEQVAMITTDSYRIAAHEQLRTYGNILDIPVKVANNHAELLAAIKQFSNRSLVLIDTAGMSQRDVRLSQQFELIKGSAPEVKTYLVLSTVTHRAGLKQVVQAFGDVKLDGCILTKLDETTSLGGALSTAIEHDLRIVYVSDGQRVPEDIHLARGHSLISRAVAIAKETNQAIEQETLNLAFSGMVANAHG